MAETPPSIVVSGIDSLDCYQKNKLKVGLTVILAATTCFNRTAERAVLSASRAANCPAGSRLKAALTGAKMVKGPRPLTVVVRPAAWTAVSNVDKSLIRKVYKKKVILQ